MKVMMKAFAKQYFGAKYEGIAKSLTICVILFLAVYGTQLKVRIAPSVFYLTSTAFSGGIMAQMLFGRRLMENMEGMFVLPFKNRDFVLACVFMLGSHTILTKTLPVWALFLAAGQLDGAEIITGILCGCMACLVTGAMYLLWKKRIIGFPLCGLRGSLRLSCGLCAGKWWRLWPWPAALVLCCICVLQMLMDFCTKQVPGGPFAILEAGEVFLYICCVILWPIKAAA